MKKETEVEVAWHLSQIIWYLKYNLPTHSCSGIFRLLGLSAVDGCILASKSFSWEKRENPN